MWLGAFLGSGSLSEHHTEMDDIRYCFDCHNLFWGVPDEKCRVCHRELDLQAKDKRGMHRKWKDECIHCHSEHAGYSSKILSVDKKVFPHDKTAFGLRGKHLKISCEKCHKAKAEQVISSYCGLDISCYSCHKKTPHPRVIDKRCGVCHTESSWKDVGKVQNLPELSHKGFNFALAGKHKEVKCPKCHKNNKFSKMSYKLCSDCHKDPHKGQFKKRPCEVCHDTNSWKKTIFDHAKTKLPLVGFHKRPMCKSCHPNKVFNNANPACEKCHDDSNRFFMGLLPWSDVKHPDKMSRLLKCLDCHKSDDPLDNIALLRKRCVKCHNEYYGKIFDYWKEEMPQKFNKLIPYIIKLAPEERTKYNRRFIFMRKKYYHNLALSRRTIKEMKKEMKDSIKE